MRRCADASSKNTTSRSAPASGTWPAGQRIGLMGYSSRIRTSRCLAALDAGDPRGHGALVNHGTALPPERSSPPDTR